MRIVKVTRLRVDDPVLLPIHVFLPGDDVMSPLQTLEVFPDIRRGDLGALAQLVDVDGASPYQEHDESFTWFQKNTTKQKVMVIAITPYSITMVQKRMSVKSCSAFTLSMIYSRLYLSFVKYVPVEGDFKCLTT